MSITAAVTNYIKFTGDIEAEFILSSGEQGSSPAIRNVISLDSGNNVISVPDVDDFVVHGLAIVPPNGNTEEITLKGTNTDTGIALSATKATVIQLGAAPPASIVLVAGTNVSGFQLFWF